MNEKGKEQSVHTKSTCTGKIEVPTPREAWILARMKSIKERVRDIKNRLKAVSKSDEKTVEIRELEEELVHLKTQWQKWDRERQRAAQERMILLGHEEEKEV